MKRQPLVSVLIVNWNGGEVFGECLESLKKIDYPNWEIVVVDNSSIDKSGELVWGLRGKARQIKLIRNRENVGFAEGNNQALKRAGGEYILLLNNDTKVPGNLIAALVQRIEREPKLGVIQPKILMMDKKGYLDNAGSFMTRIGFLDHWGFGRRDSKEFDEERKIFSAKGACMLIKREVIKKGSLFDPKFVSYFEESDFCWRVWLAGWGVLYFPEIQIEHKVGFTIKRLDVVEINYHYYKNRIRSLVKNFGFMNLILIVPVHLGISLGIAMLFAFRGKWKNSTMILRAIGWNAINLPDTWKERRKVQRMRKVNDRELFEELMRPVSWRKFYMDFKRVEEDIGR